MYSTYNTIDRDYISSKQNILRKMYPCDCFVVTGGMYLSIISDATIVSTFLCTLNTMG